MLVRSVIYRKNGWGFNFIRPFQKETTISERKLSFLFVLFSFHDSILLICQIHQTENLISCGF